MLESRWDLFATKSSPGSLWFAAVAAKGLVDRRQVVRLITDDTATLSRAVNDIDPRLWLQRYGGYDVLDVALAAHCAASPRVVQFFDSDIPRPYLSRLVSQPVRADWIQVESCALEAGAHRALKMIESSTTHRRYRVRLGDPPQHGGYLRQRHHSLLMRQRWSHRRIRLSLLNILGLPADALDGRTIVYIAGAADLDLAPWARLFSTQQAPMTIFVEDGQPAASLARGLGLAESTRGYLPMGVANVVLLPPIQWFVSDELIGIADVAMTDLPDIAMRAAECGTPLILASRTRSGQEFAEWYLAGSAPAVKHAIEDAFRALTTGEHVGQAWQWYLNVLFEAGKHAAGLSQRIQRGADLVDVLIASLTEQFSPSSPEQFSPTLPHPCEEA